MHIQESINNLNQEQHQAVVADKKPLLVIAGAGTGKTQVLTLRMAFMINYFGISPDRILGFTFTNKAAREMRERVQKLINVNIAQLGTFHSFCVRVLREDVHLLDYDNNFRILDTAAAIDLLHLIYEEHKIDYKEYPYKKVLSFISSMKSSNGEYINQKFQWKDNAASIGQVKKDLTLIFNLFVEKCATFSYVDYDDLLILTYQIFTRFEDVLKKWQNRFDAVLVDEFQDTNEIQYQLAYLLARKHQNIFAVGDPDQTIYSFRGAKAKVLEQFQHDFPTSEIIVLKINYRSTQQILNAANQLINVNPRSLKKELESYFGQHKKPVFKTCYNIDEEVEFIVDKISLLIDEHCVKPENICVLFRSNQMSRAIEQALIENGIIYNLFGSRTFFEREEIRDILAYFQVINNWDELALIRIINKPRRKIGGEAFDNLKRFAKEHKYTLAEALSHIRENNSLNDQQMNRFINFYDLILDMQNYNENHDLVSTFYYLIDKIAYREFLDLKPDTADNKWENVMELRNGLERYLQNIPGASLNDYLNDIALYTNDDSKKLKNNAINLMTVHTSKGLEFEYVFLMRMNQGDFPSSYSIAEANGIEEERRVCYVALTRAKKELYITASLNNSFRNEYAGQISQFIEEIGVNNLENLSPHLSMQKPKKENLMANLMQARWGEMDELEQLSRFTQTQKIVDQNYHDGNNNYAINDEVEHKIFGSGVVVGKNDDLLDIYFHKSKKVLSICYNIKSLSRKEK
ncbi:ATP-dependent helicase [Ureaplasma miroungigenitalium]|uniref:DNA 3'-5' helicase n=1 Tax=Ureaplasma miroungigenitalium TaxID=1042321 RepID=A0ABT3BMB5_9BACT|nr:ATP-dependent helicase [Ureaplasma miroungigenitalium]MCV3728372.1 ATP-dependent helicase [Ureaplasma miroungigenitalium]MCV3734159.1 ATP-dependent helicase [Ureaplasma miroungigenitalium]